MALSESNPITLDEVNQAIRDILLVGTSNAIAGRTFTRASLPNLESLRDRIIREEERAENNGALFVVESHNAGGSSDDWGA